MKNTPYYEASLDERARRTLSFHEPVDYYPAHYHRKIELTYVLGGSFKTTLDGRSYEVFEDEMCFVPSYLDHDYATSKDCRRLVLIPGHEIFQNVENAMQSKQFLSFILDDRKYNAEILLPILELLYKNCVSSELVQQGLVEYFFGKLFERYPLYQTDRKKQALQKIEILQFIEAHYSDELSLQTISHQFGYTKYHFSRLFNELTGTNLNAYVNKIRIEEFIKRIHAKGLTETNVCDTAFAVGFNSMPTFYRAFKDVSGAAPSEFFKKEAE